MFVAGDSITKILSAGRMSDNNVQTKIKSHPGGRVRAIETTIVMESQQNHIKDASVIVLHTGTNNVSDGDPCESIIEEFKDTIDTIGNVNSSAKIVISSILPRKNDRLVNNHIRLTNRALQEMCDEEELHFLNNDDLFIKGGKVDVSLFSDHIHLNAKGGRILGTNIRAKLNDLLGVDSASSSQNFQYGRYRERTNSTHQRVGRQIPTIQSWRRPRQWQDNWNARRQYQWA